ncbi:MAG: trehalose-phosphatase, partial [Cytophagales bacterium]|nr:trehalose-phosphatase [Cytophagales bacterium]
ALLHARAWKKMFETFLKSRRNGPFQPLDIPQDYIRYIDGKPRNEGVRSFLASRKIHLHEGVPSDPPGLATVYGLGNLKNRIFLQLVEEEGVDVYQDTITWVKQWRDEGKKTAVVSASKNCAFVLERAGLQHLFDVRVDGVTTTRLNLPGKPAPDLFLRAAAELGVPPGRAVVVENAIPGVRVGSKGDFGLVVGVARYANEAEWLENGADVVVRSLEELRPAAPAAKRRGEAAGLPSALEKLQWMGSGPVGRNVAVFLDFDGTLAPIVPRPEDARMPGEVRELVRQLAATCTVAVVSGRDRADVAGRVGIPEIIYAGSHGFDIGGPGGIHLQHREGETFLPDLYQARKDLLHRLAGVEGIQIERKKYAVAVHYRNVPRERQQEVREVVHAIAHAMPRLHPIPGKKVVELRPAIDWHTGKAVGWIMEALQLDAGKVLPLYIGDDLTDEDAFRFLKGKGVGILVGDHGAGTDADYRLKDLGQVKQLLHILVKYFQA